MKEQMFKDVVRSAEQAGIVTKVYQEPQLESRCFEVILNLGPVFVGEFRYRFEFKDDFVVTDEVRRVLRAQGAAFVFQREWFLRRKRDSCNQSSISMPLTGTARGRLPADGRLDWTLQFVETLPNGLTKARLESASWPP